MEPDCILDTRDIRNVQPEEILAATGLQAGELDLFDGSLPCQAFSTAGQREKGWGKAKSYEHGARQCNETLFDEYIRILRGLRPKVFVAENVSGLVKGVAKGWFLDVLKALKESGYRVKAKLLDAQWLGVPQMRQRIIFIGVREDLQRNPVHPEPLPYRYSVRDALPWIDNLTLGAHGFQEERIIRHTPVATIAASGMTSYRYHVEAKPVITTLSSDAQFEVTERLQIIGRVGSQFKKEICPLEKPLNTVMAGGHTDQFEIETDITHPTERRKFTIAELKRICAFPDDFILTGSYAQQWERLGNSVPPVMMRAIAEKIRDEVFA
jgi:DNA (cytosine-5)-methyltransferase 1